MRGDWEPNTATSATAGWSTAARSPGAPLPAAPVTSARTGIAYKVRPQDRGKRITVQVSGRAPGYETVTKTSAATAPVRA